MYVRPDVANPRHRVWFNFTVENVRADQVSACILLILYFVDERGFYIMQMQIQAHSYAQHYGGKDCSKIFTKKELNNL